MRDHRIIHRRRADLTYAGSVDPPCVIHDDHDHLSVTFLLKELESNSSLFRCVHSEILFSHRPPLLPPCWTLLRSVITEEQQWKDLCSGSSFRMLAYIRSWPRVYIRVPTLPWALSTVPQAPSFQRNWRESFVFPMAFMCTS